jgi:hypothetical protein
MNETLDRERTRIILDVQNGRLTPEEAEALAEKMGLDAFEKAPDPLIFDPDEKKHWTLPMAAAWFIWRSADAVRDQMDGAR